MACCVSTCIQMSGRSLPHTLAQQPALSEPRARTDDFRHRQRRCVRTVGEVTFVGLVLAFGVAHVALRRTRLLCRSAVSTVVVLGESARLQCVSLARYTVSRRTYLSIIRARVGREVQLDKVVVTTDGRARERRMCTDELETRLVCSRARVRARWCARRLWVRRMSYCRKRRTDNGQDSASNEDGAHDPSSTTRAKVRSNMSTTLSEFRRLFL
jgi:hypothetical protein